jgi:hypothetical protein
MVEGHAPDGLVMPSAVFQDDLPLAGRQYLSTLLMLSRKTSKRLSFWM